MVLLLSYVVLSCKRLVTMTRTNAIPTISGVFIGPLQNGRKKKIILIPCLSSQPGLGCLRTYEHTKSYVRCEVVLTELLQRLYERCTYFQFLIIVVVVRNYSCDIHTKNEESYTELYSHRTNKIT